MWYLAVVLLCSTAIFAGLWLDTRQANIQLQHVHARSSAWAAWRINSLQVDVLMLGRACDRWAKFDRVQVRKISDQARQIHDLQAELNLRNGVGAEVISIETQARIDKRVDELSQLEARSM